MNKKKTVTVSVLVVLLALLIGGATMAYFTDTDSKTNTFTVGDVDITLNEPNWNEPDYVTPGETYTKDPYVYNEGPNDAWVRMNVTVSDYKALSAAASAHGITDLSTIFAGHDETAWTLAGTPAVDTTKDTVTYSYYYNVPIAKETNTGYLFTSVTIPKEFTSEEMATLGDDFTIDITADAIQKEGFTTPAAAFAAFDAA